MNTKLNTQISSELFNKIGNYENKDSSVTDFFQLLKPRVMSLAIFTAIIGLIIAPGYINPILAFISILSIAVGAGAAGALNMWYDSDIDSVMLRTKKRPIVMGKISKENALAFGIFLSFFSILILSICVNFLAGALLLLSILFYIFVYTIWLKRKTEQNIVIGGAAGAFPPMIGYASVTGTIDLNSIILFSIIFFWTPAHFWALALYKSSDYKRANIPMMPIVKGDNYTRLQIVIYTIITTIFTILPSFIGFMGLTYLIASTILNILFIYYSISLYLSKNNLGAPFLFKYSIIYLFLIFSFLGLNSIL